MTSRVTAPSARIFAPKKTGLRHWWDSYLVMMRFEILSLRTFLVSLLVIQTLMGAGMAVMYGFFLGDIPELGRTFLVSGIPALALFPVGFVIVPSVVADHRFEETYDYIWSLPTPRIASALASFTVFTVLGLPGTAVALGVSTVVFGVSLSPSLALIPAIIVSASIATSVGYAIGHGVKNPRLVNILTNLLVFLVLMFSPIVVPIEQYPNWFASFHRVLPFWHMANVLRASLTNDLVANVATSYFVLVAWAVAAWTVTVRVIKRRS
jgi:ABC-2 type transport system permease protein